MYNEIINPFIIQPFIFEEWRLLNIEGVVKDYYYVSNCGRVKNIHGQIIKPYIINTGYMVYRLYTGHKPPGKYKHYLAHRLVMDVFEPISHPEKLTVNHKNLDKHYNVYRNLERISQSDNNIHSIVNHKLHGTGNYQAAFNKDQLRIIVDELSKGTSYTNILIMIGMVPNDNNRDYIGNIKRGKTYVREVQEILDEKGSTTIPWR